MNRTPYQKVSNLKVLSLVGIALVLASCGGSSGSSSSTSPMKFFISDSMDANDQVWVKIYKVELIGSDDVPKSVFEDTNGLAINVRALRDTTGARFMLISGSDVPNGTYKGFKVLLDRKLTVFEPGASTGKDKNFESLPTDPAGKRTVNFTFTTPLVVNGAAEDRVLDFDLANWIDDAGGVKPIIKDGNRTGLDDARRHERNDFHGSISGLEGTPPAQSFTLSVREGIKIQVTSDASTVVFREDGAANPVLSNNLRVEVNGSFDPTTKRVVAKTIKIEDERQVDDPEVFGAVLSSSKAEGKIRVKVQFSNLVVPAQTEISIQTNATTVFRTMGGVLVDADTFFNLIGTEAQKFVEAEGEYNRETGVLTAKKLKIEDRNNGIDNPEAEAEGNTSNPNLEAGTFSLSLAEWQGFSWSPSSALTVKAVTTTSYFNKNGTALSKADFFAGLSTTRSVKVYGRLQAGALVANKLKYKN